MRFLLTASFQCIDSMPPFVKIPPAPLYERGGRVRTAWSCMVLGVLPCPLERSILPRGWSAGNYNRHILLEMEMHFWLLQAEAALAQSGRVGPV